MSTLTAIQDAQSILINPLTGSVYNYTHKRLLVRIPISLVDVFNPNKEELWRFDPTLYNGTDTNSFVYLVFFPEYTSEDEVLSGQGLKVGFSVSSLANLSTMRRGFSCSISQRNSFYFYILERVLKLSNLSTGYGYTPIKVIDFCLPEPNDEGFNVVSHSEIGTVRFGKIEITKRPEGTIFWQGGNYFKSDWDFRFIEAKLRQ